MKRVLWYLIAGTRGGLNRAKIIKALSERPYNANQLAEELGVDYKTMRHHLDVLVKNKILMTGGDKYGAMYFISDNMEKNMDEFNKIWDTIVKKDDPVNDNTGGI